MLTLSIKVAETNDAIIYLAAQGNTLSELIDTAVLQHVNQYGTSLVYPLDVNQHIEYTKRLLDFATSFATIQLG